MAYESGVHFYLAQIARVPLLTAEQERELSRRLIRENDPAARDEMICSNLRLVVNIAKNYANRGMALQDLIEEGNLGLLKAVEGFNPELNIRFSTYASWWIKQAIRRALINAVQPIHVPGYMVEMIAKWKQALADLEESLGCAPTLEMLARHMKIPAKMVRMIAHAMRASLAPTQANANNTIDWHEIPQGDSADTPDHAALGREELQTMHLLLDTMDPRQARILRLRFGLDDSAPMTLGEIGDLVGLTRERVRQIENMALGKLKAHLATGRRPYIHHDPCAARHERHATCASQAVPC